ncbi:Fructose-1,6-bisphosphatase class 3 [bioreactor metagenome]|uniref:Fructose-1,6-bisphosphatase class 3 n=1 Tax=bioreactor metagenome TaxID=1076179 RepID=A0A645DMU1_9ZZZZ
MLRLEAVQRLPKGTELFLSDVHGEDEAFTHLINNASGIIDEKIMKALPDLPERERHVLCSLITYPHEQLLRMEETAGAGEWDGLMRRLVAVAREAADEARTLLVPLDTAFEHETARAEARRDPATGYLFTKDGTHPTPEGYRLIARTLLRHWRLD